MKMLLSVVMSSGCGARLRRESCKQMDEQKKELIQEGFADITELCKAMAGIYDLAYDQYKSLVEEACKRKMPENEVCHLLDYLLDFACEDRCLSLYKKVCRYYYSFYSRIITEYVELYREMWDSEEEDQSGEGSSNT